jgi:hypothetical protein
MRNMDRAAAQKCQFPSDARYRMPPIPGRKK